VKAIKCIIIQLLCEINKNLLNKLLKYVKLNVKIINNRKKFEVRFLKRKNL